jgi:hypothetical protein
MIQPTGLPPNKRFDTDPQQQRFAPLSRAGQSPLYGLPRCQVVRLAVLTPS